MDLATISWQLAAAPATDMTSILPTVGSHADLILS